MKYLSVCSGIEAATVAWHSLGWEPLAFSEIEPFPRKVLSHHYPDVPLHGDFTLLREQDWIKDADILVGGTPCQAFSVAGLRHSLDDDRGNLTLEFVRLADAIDAIRSIPCTIVWENVPGVLSVKDNAFGCFLGALAGEDAPLVAPGGRWSNAGFVDGPKRTIAWRILDAQYFGVAQRRRRVFVVASARTDFDPAEILFEFEGLRRDTPPSRQKGQEPSATIAARFGISRNNHEECVSMTLQARMGAAGFDLDTETPIISERRTGSGKDIFPSLMANVGTKLWLGNQEALSGDYHILEPQPIAFREVTDSLTASYGTKWNGNASADNGSLFVAQFMAVRRLTPRECERLQGFPDDYTAIPGAADGPRYKSLGNSMAVPVMAWIGKRIANALVRF
jgi:DNA (cytosine-5)-methyltransferase 1